MVSAMLAQQARKPDGAFGMMFADRMFAWHKIYYARALGILMAQPAESVMEIGVGSAGMARAFLDADMRYIGVDHSPDVIEAGRAKCPDAEWVLADVQHADLPAADCAVSINTMHWVPDAVRALHAVRRALPDGGMFVVGVPDILDDSEAAVGGAHCYTARMLADQYDEAGFSDVTADTLHLPWGVYFLGSGRA